MQRSYRQNSPVIHCQLPGMDFLKRKQNMSRCIQRINSHVGHGAMTARSLYPDLKIIGCRSADAGICNDHRTGFKRHPRRHMNHQRRIHIRIVQQAGFYHIAGTLKDLFGRLKHEFYRTFYLLFMHLQKFCRAQQHGRVHVVPAGVHTAIHRRKILLCFFFDGQCIHIRPKQKYFPFSLPSRQGDQTGFTAFFSGTASCSWLTIPFPYSLHIMIYSSSFSSTISKPAF